MKLTETLSSEHRVIEQAILALDAAADLIEGGGQVRPGFFQDAAGFIAGFADGYHHAKEERVLFDAMARHGMPTESGPIAVMLYEHDEGRRLTAGLRDAAQRLAAGDASASRVVADYARAYGELLRQHIFKEDNILFPMAARVIDPGAWDDILREAERVEAERAGGDSKTYYAHLAKALCEEMGVDPAAAHGRSVELPCHAR
jgi:hemerythrin-like domain-containing protein